MSEAEQTTSSASTTSTYRYPTMRTYENVTKLAIVEDKPIMFDYWVDSCDKKIVIGVKEDGEKLLVKNSEEYTSPIAKIYKVDTEFIIVTENSIYLVDNSISTKRISA